MAKLIEYITPTWIREKEDECIPIYDPTIDGERIELVRCKDCKYQHWVNAETGNIVCKIGGRGANPPDWFCADGKKKDGA